MDEEAQQQQYYEDDEWDEGDEDEEDAEDAARQSTYSFSPEDVIGTARCVFPFDSTCDVELSLKEGDIVNITSMDVGGGWWEGELNGAHGLFPESYVEMMSTDGGNPTAPSDTAAPQSDYQASSETSSVQRESREYMQPSSQGQPRDSVPPGAPFITSGHKWHSGSDPMHITVKKSDQKGSKFSGVKKFTVYEITSTTTVTRRFKHFVWLHERLGQMFPCINIPPIPTKQLQGRFEADFIEDRRRKLERFLNRVNGHPVMASSSVFRHFLTATDQKEWKTGKRKAEADSSDSTFLTTVVASDPLPSDYSDLLMCFKKFNTWYSKTLHQLEASLDTLAKCSHATHDALNKVSANFKKFGDPSLFCESKREDYQPWWDSETSMLEMLNSLGLVGEGIIRMADLLQEQENENQAGLIGFVKEYSGLLKSFQTVFKTLDGKWQEQQAALSKETTPPDVQAELTRNCETATAAVLAELRHFYEQASHDLGEAMRGHIESNIQYNTKVIEIWHNLQDQIPQ